MARTYIIAEAGVNHNGDLTLAKKLIDVAVNSGADAIKFQTFITEHEVSIGAPKAQYQIDHTGEEQSQFEMLKQLELTENQHFELVAYCEERGIEFLSSPFDMFSMRFLCDELRLPTIKIASGEITNVFMLHEIARRKKKVILSSGMASIGEIEKALMVLAHGYLHDEVPVDEEEFSRAFCSPEGQAQLAKFVQILHCTTNYPCPIDEVNLNVIPTLQAAFRLPVGYSDHTTSVFVPALAVAKGATIIEKHITLDKQMAGPDHAASLTEQELVQMIQAIRECEQTMGSTQKIPTSSEFANRHIARKSLVTTRFIAKGEKITAADLTVKRPGSGISPFDFWKVIGRVAQRDIHEDEVLSYNDCQ